MQVQVKTFLSNFLFNFKLITFCVVGLCAIVSLIFLFMFLITNYPVIGIPLALATVALVITIGEHV